jgi:hypothetical protein
MRRRWFSHPSSAFVRTSARPSFSSSTITGHAGSNSPLKAESLGEAGRA